MKEKDTGATKEVRIIKNKDIPLLSRVLYVMQDIRSLENRCEWQSTRLFNVTQQITGMPRGGGGNSGFDAVFAEMDELNEEHRERLKAYVRELKAAEKIINSIPSRTMRTFVVMMYVENQPDAVVQRELNMSRRGFENARNAVEIAESMASVAWRERYMIQKG